MKTLLVIMAVLTLAASPLLSQTNTPPTPETKAWWHAISVTPFGAVSHTDFEGKPTWGTGLDVGYSINKDLSVHGSLMSTDEDNWGGNAIDETSILVKYDLIQDARGRFVGSLLGSVDRYWSDSDGSSSHNKEHGKKCGGVDDGWGLGAGAAGEFRFTKNFSFGVDYRVRLREEAGFGSLGRGFFRLRF